MPLPHGVSQGLSPQGAFGIAVLSVPLHYPKRCVPEIPWAGPLSKSRSVSSLALSSLGLPVQQGTQTSAPCGERWVGPAATTPAASFTSKASAWCPTSPLYLGISLFCGQQRSVWKRSSDSPLRAFTESFNPGLLSQRHLESSPALIPSTFNSLVCDMSLLLNQIKKICYLFFINT